MNPLSETWLIHNRINLYLLSAMDEVHLNDQSASKGRTVGQQFAHIHSVRMMWLKVADPLLLEGLPKIEKENISKPGLEDALTLSGRAIDALFEKTVLSGKIKGFKPNATAFLGYLIFARIAPPGYQIMLSLKQSGHIGRSKNSIRPVGVGCKMRASKCPVIQARLWQKSWV